MTLKRLQFLFLLLLVASSVAAQTSEAPVVNECEPHSGSVNSAIYLRGFRLGSDGVDPAKVFFIQNGIEIPANAGGGFSTSNDRLNGPQGLRVIVPDEVVPGAALIVAERNGLRSAPITFTIIEWTPPVIKQIIPTSGPPGTTVAIECENFHPSDEIELTDSEGRLVKPQGGAGYSHGTAFTVPADFPEDVLTIRIGNRKFGKGQFTPAVEFIVTNDALQPKVVAEWIKPVAPGQWIDIQVSTFESLKHSEQTEVSFKQAGREIIVNAPRPRDPHVEVPAVLSRGDVQLQVRTWRHGRPSSWSDPVSIQLSEKPLPPNVYSLRHEGENPVDLWPGPDRAKSFKARPGDLILMNGLFPVAGADKLKVLLVRFGQVVELDVSEANEKDPWFGLFRMKLPTDIGSGDWQMILRAIDGTEHVVPIPIRISAKF